MRTPDHGETALKPGVFPGGTQLTLSYRYLTPALAGPWRVRHEEAIEDAIRAGQAARDTTERPDYTWLVNGRIEAAAEPLIADNPTAT
jgi:hypothetical protein